MRVEVYNSFTDHQMVLESSKKNLKFTDEDQMLEFDRWCNKNLEENGFYELDGGLDDPDTFIIQIDDDNDDWKENFDIVVEKLKKYLCI